MTRQATTRQATTRQATTRTKAAPLAVPSCANEPKLSRANAAVAANRETDSTRRLHEAYRCGICLLPSGTAAWHVRPARRLLGLLPRRA
ncbi:hypothetical protein [Motilibacter aurantiacus]|uniref:hypothetical protein n=1 Tax=Motilibacter aurantiacus TaxID=2714955 RepID=UPI0014078C5E|nr:hypothetical protein [Motilibacter aurantiacus]NHC46618.1 hypothetical protein [Motilibacter aurantiacus]